VAQNGVTKDQPSGALGHHYDWCGLSHIQTDAEPASLALLGVGLLCLGVVNKRPR